LWDRKKVENLYSLREKLLQKYKLKINKKVLIKFRIGKHAYSHLFFLRAMIIICDIPNVITYLDRTFQEEQNEISLLNWCTF
jgi:hypothetical protein